MGKGDRLIIRLKRCLNAVLKSIWNDGTLLYRCPLQNIFVETNGIIVIEKIGVGYQRAAGFRANKALEDRLAISDNLRSSLAVKNVSKIA